MSMRTLLAVGGLGLASCTITGPDVGEVTQAARCTKDFCGGNSPTVGHYGLWELELHGAVNDQGFRLLGLSKAQMFYELDVVDSRMIGRDRKGIEVLSGTGLAGARIWLEREEQQYAIVISEVGEFGEVVAPHGKLETYVLDWADVIASPLPGPVAAGSVEKEPVIGPTSSVCPSPDWTASGGRVEWDEAAKLSPYQSIVFEGDRFDPVTRTVAAAAQNNWFNIGCGAHTLAKLRLTRNTINTAPAWTNVQAAFKMLSADYCGTGRAITVDGEPIVWRDRTAMQYWNEPGELEARWTHQGATCVHVPRLTSSELLPNFDAWRAIDAECGRVGRVMPKCANLDPHTWDTRGELVTSANYD